LYPILVFTFCIFIFSITYYAKGNGYLAVYIGGLVLGNAKFVHKRSSLNFFDGLAWMSQLLMFLTLGLLVNPHELLPILIPGIIISLSIIFIARPLSIFISLSPFRKMSFKDRSYISWVGLRGAVPIIFAIIPLAEEIPNARLIFNIVFLSTLISLIIQGNSLSILANWLGLAEESPKIKKMRSFDVDFSNDIKSITSEIEITEAILNKGNKLMDLALPQGTLAVLVKREDNYFIPKGNTILEANDKLLIITDNAETLLETYKGLGIEES
ncbi:MAG TPA: cation:proton antiporter, partial [Melioribacteraceae bacterium]|nr:cation:proton antiporter [Melioribacteraceae bacterium]